MDLSKIKIHPYTWVGLQNRLKPIEVFTIALERACNFYNLSEEEVLGKTRKRDVVDARTVIAKYVWKICSQEISLRVLGGFFGRYKHDGRGDHTVVINYLKRYDNLKHYDHISMGYKYLVNPYSPTQKRVIYTGCKTGIVPSLTEDKEYSVHEETKERYYIRTDDNKAKWYLKQWFREI